MTKHSKNTTFMMILLTMIFFVPMLIAWLTYSKGLFLSNHKVHHGLLLQPPVQIATWTLASSNESVPAINNLKGKWWLVYLTDSPKESLSQRNLYYMRQIRQATGKDRDRVERALITVNNTADLDKWLKQNYPGMHHFIISDEKIRQLEANFPKKLALKKGSLYLVDPLGNIMLLYAPDAAPKGILKDLQRLLKVSQIG